MTGDQLNFKMATERGQPRIDQVFARARTSASEGRTKHLQQLTRILGTPPPPTSRARKMPKTLSKSRLVLGGPPFNWGGGRVSGINQNIFFYDPADTFFFQLLGHQIIYFTFTLEWTVFFWRQLYISTVGSYKLLPSLLLYLLSFYHLALNCLFQKTPAPLLEIN